MNTNSPSESLWQLLHHAHAVLTDRGFSGPLPPLPEGSSADSRHFSSEGYADLAARYGEHLAFRTTWPEGLGSDRVRALILCSQPLSESALAFVRSWFENPTVKLNLEQDFFVQPLPEFGGEHPPYRDLIRDLCLLFQPKAVLSLGPIPAQRALGAPLSLETLRGSDYRFEQWSIITTAEPETFSTLAEDAQKQYKGQIWKDLQRLLGKIRYG